MNHTFQTIVITGGHMTPALAVIDEIRTSLPHVKLTCLGRLQTFEGISSPSNEKRLMEEKDVQFIPITAGRIRRFFEWSTLLSLVKIPVGFVQAFFYLFFHRPQCILTFGGYIAVPVALAGKILGIPIVTHEQTSVPGSGNMFIGTISDKICVSFPQTIDLFEKGKAIFTGLPLRSSMKVKSEKHSVHIPKTLPFLYVTGGSTGARSMNEVFFPLISLLISSYVIVHQTGVVSYPKAKRISDGLPNILRDRYVAEAFFDETDVSYFLHHARLVIGRAGANSVAEILYSGVPAILIPLPWSGEGEQWSNARIASTLGPITLFDQRKETSESLLFRIRETMRNGKRQEQGRSIFFAPPDAARKIVHELLPFMNGKKISS